MPETEQVIITFSDDDSADQLAANMVAALNAGFSRGLKIDDVIKKMFTGASSTGRKFAAEQDKIWDSVIRGSKQATRSVDAFATTMQGIKATGRSGVLDPQVFDATSRSFNRLEDNIERIIRNFRELSTTAGGRQVLGDLTAAIRSQANQANVVQQSMTRVAEQEAKARTEAARVAQQRTTALEVAGSKERIVAAQQEGARSLAATRASAQQRVEVFRAAVGQIRALERGLGSLFSGSARAVGAGASGISGIFSNLVAQTRSSTRQMNAALATTDGALDRRTSAFRRSFGQQERAVRSSVHSQITQIQRLDAAVSTGLTGALTGRSAIAGTLGIGGIIGAGAGIFRVLRDGLTAGADFTQGLAVLDSQLQLTDEQLKSVRQTSLDLGNDISLPGVSALDAAQAIGLLSKQFADLGTGAAPAAEAAAKGVLALSRATQATAEDSAQIVGAAVNVFDLAADQATLVADKVTTALTLAAGTSSTEFAQAFKQGASVFAQFQGEALGAEGALDQFNGALAILAREGIVGSDAGTSLRAFFLQGTRQADEATAASKKLAEQAGVTGNVFYDEAGNTRALSESVDILRKATAGMNEEQRNAALGILFGSDAIRSANALIGTTAEEYEKVIQQMRRQGTAAELAAAQNQGLRGAMDALGSVIETQLILVYEKFQVAAGNAVLVVAEFVNNLAGGEGVYAMVRTGLKGIALGLGALVGIKAVVEGFGLLKVILGGLLTPLGLLVAGFALAGAAFALLMEHSEEFRAAVSKLRDGLKAFWDSFRSNDDVISESGLVGFFERLGASARNAFNYIGDTVIPKLKELAGTIRDFVTDVITGSDQEDLFLLALTGSDTRTIGEKIGDKIRDLAGPVINAFNTAREFVFDAIRGSDQDDEFFLRYMGIDTRTAGEKAGDRIREIIGTVRRALDTAVGAVADAAKTTGDAIVRFFEPARESIAAFVDEVQELLDGNLAKAIGGIGITLAGAAGGFAVAGPLGAVIGGAGAAVGAAFFTGLDDELVGLLGGLGASISAALGPVVDSVRSTLENIFTVDNLIDVGLFGTELAQRIGRVLGNALSDPRLVAGAAGLAGIAALAAARFVIGFGQGVISNVPELARLLKTALTAALEAALDALTNLSAGQLLTGLTALFIGGSALRAFRSAGTKAGDEVKQGMLASFGRGAFGGAFGGGGTTGNGVTSFIRGFLGGPGALQRAVDSEITKTTRVAQRSLGRMNAILGAAGREVRVGPGFGDAIRADFDRLVGEIGPSGVRGLQLRSGFQAVIDSVRNTSLTPVRQFFNDFGITARQALTQAMKGVASVAAGGFAGFQTGQALGGQSGLQQVLGVGGLALALGTINPAMGIAAGAAGILGVAFGNMGADAEEARQRVENLKNAILAANDAGELFTGIGAQLKKDLQDTFDTGELEGLREIEFDFGGLVERVTDGSATLRSEFDRFARASGPAGREFVAGLSPAIDTVGELRKELFSGAGSQFIDELENIGFESGDLDDMIGFLTRSIEDYDQAARDAANDDALSAQIEGTAAAAESASPAVEALIGNLRLMGFIEGLRTEQEIQNVEAAAAAAESALEDARRAADDFLNGSYRGTVQAAMDEVVLSVPSVTADLEGINASAGEAWFALQRELDAAIQEDLLGVVQADVEADITAGRVPDPSDALADLRGKLQAEIDANPEAADVPAKVRIVAGIDSLLTSPTFAADIAAVVAKITGTLPPTTVTPPVVVEPAVTMDEAALAVAIAAVIAGGAGGPQGFKGGGGVAQGQLIQVPFTIDPQVSLVGGAAAKAQAVGDQLTKHIATGVAAGATAVASAAARAISAGIIAAALVATTGTSAGLLLASRFAAGITAGTGRAVGAARSLGAAASAAVRTSTGTAFNAGVNIASGLASGIRAGTGRAVSAARSMAAQVSAAARVELGISSPSKVFHDIGTEIGRGLSQGIADQEDDLSSVVNSMLGRVIEGAFGAARASATGASAIFDTLRPGGRLGASVSGLESSRSSLRAIGLASAEIFAQSAKDLWDAASTAVGERSTRQRALADQFAFAGSVAGHASLDPRTILGNENRARFLQLGESIADFASEALAAGTDVRAVVAEVQEYRKNLIDQALAAGAAGKDIDELITMLGLMDSQLHEMTRQVDDFNRAAATPSAPTPEEDAAADEREKEAREREEENRRLMLELLRIVSTRPSEIHTHIPFGDPEAVALATFNKIASGLSV